MFEDKIKWDDEKMKIYYEELAKREVAFLELVNDVFKWDIKYKYINKV